MAASSIVAAASVLALGAAAGPVTVSLVAVELVQPQEQRELGRALDRPLLRVQFESTTELRGFARARGATIFASGRLCEHPDDDVLLVMPSIYHDGVGLMRGSEAPISPEKSGRFLYSIFLSASAKDNARSRPPQRAFDLLKSPEDICIFVHGGNQLGFAYSSNVLRIEASDLARASQAAQSGDSRASGTRRGDT